MQMSDSMYCVANKVLHPPNKRWVLLFAAESGMMLEN